MKSVLVTRARHQAGEFSALLKKRGFLPVEVPMIELKPPRSYRPIDRALSHLHNYDWILLTSANAVDFFFRRAHQKKTRLEGLRFGVVGPKTAASLKRYRCKPSFVASDFRAEGVLSAFKKRGASGQRVLLPQAEEARDVLEKGLKKLGARVTRVVLYRMTRPRHLSVKVRKMLKKGKIDVVTFASPSSVQNFSKFFTPGALRKIFNQSTVACLGPVTEQRVRQLGVSCPLVPRESTLMSLVRALQRNQP